MYASLGTSNSEMWLLTWVVLWYLTGEELRCLLCLYNLRLRIAVAL